MSLDKRLREFHVEDEQPDVERALVKVQHGAKRAQLIRRAGVAALTVAAVVAAIVLPRVLAGQDEPEGFITPPPSPGPSISSRPAVSTGRARLIAYIDKQDLWVYDVRADRTTRLTTDGDERVEAGPEFLGVDYILYIANEPSAIEAIPVGGGRPRPIIREEGTVFDFDVSSDGSKIVYIQTNFDTDGVHRLKLVDLPSGRSSVLRTLGEPIGRGAGSEDEVSVAWSPDGRTILVTDTAVGMDPTESIFLLDLHGRPVIPPWSGTHARWSPDGRTIHYRGYAGISGVGWHVFDLATKSSRKLNVRGGTNNLIVSPDGRRVAYDTSYFGDFPPQTIQSKEAPAVYAYDLRRGKETLLKAGGLFPLWTSSDELLVTDARRPPPRARTLNSWEALGTVTRVSLTGTKGTVAITSTSWDAAVLYDG